MAVTSEMHIFRADGGTHFFRDSELSDEVTIVRDGEEFSLPCSDIRDWVADAARAEVEARRMRRALNPPC